MAFEVAVLVVPTKGKLVIQKTLFKITAFWDDIVLIGNHLSTFFKELDAPFFMVDNEDYTESGVRNLLRNIGN